MLILLGGFSLLIMISTKVHDIEDLNEVFSIVEEDKS